MIDGIFHSSGFCQKKKIDIPGSHDSFIIRGIGKKGISPQGGQCESPVSTPAVGFTQTLGKGVSPAFIRTEEKGFLCRKPEIHEKYQ
jgi:hypothetical protein